MASERDAVKRYAIIGTGNRASMFFRATTDTYADRCELVALCDLNQTRMDVYNRRLTDAGKPAVATFKADRFEEMVEQARPDVVIVCTRDSDHHLHVIRAMELGCDVICEKPMTTEAGKCQAILDAIERTGRKCTVTFNARYGPYDTKVKELISSGVIGRVTSVDYGHLLDIDHGADYFRRWHRDKANSGGLMVHKCTHCFDLVNWWVDSTPETVFAFGGVKFYGDQAGQAPAGRGPRCAKCDITDQCKFFLDLSASEKHRDLYLAAEHEDGYWRDRCVFDSGVTTEDCVSVNVRYASGTLLTYSLLAFSPYEGSKVVFNGTKGRIELGELNTLWEAGQGNGKLASQKKTGIMVFPQFAEPYPVEVEKISGGHGGADTGIVRDLFGPPAPDPLGRQADHFDGARSLLMGVAANRSMATGRPVRLDELVQLPPRTPVGAESHAS